MRSFARRYWFVPTGIVVALLFASYLDTIAARVIVLTLATLNLIGTLIIVAPDWEARGDKPGCLVEWTIRGEDRTNDVYGLLFVLQVPLGTLVVIGLVILALIGGV